MYIAWLYSRGRVGTSMQEVKLGCRKTAFSDKEVRLLFHLSMIGEMVCELYPLRQAA